MFRRCSVSQWLYGLIYLVLFISWCVSSPDGYAKQNFSSEHSSENIKKDIKIANLNGDDSEHGKSLKEHHSRTVARKGVSLSDDKIDSNSESCDKLIVKNQSSLNCTNHLLSESNKTEKNLLKADKTAVIKFPKNMTLTTKGTGNKTNSSTTSKPVMKPLYTSDDYSSADYIETNNLYPSDANWFLTTFSLSIFVVFLVLLIIVLFYKLKYKFSVHQNYRRVDYLIDGLYESSNHVLEAESCEQSQLNIEDFLPVKIRPLSEECGTAEKIPNMYHIRAD